MSKTPINFDSINTVSKSYLKNFVSARISIAKEDQRHRDVIKPLKEKLEVIHKNRDNDIAQGIPLDDVIRKHSTVKTDSEIRKENILHKKLSVPLRETLKDTYKFIPEGLYEAYIRKIELSKRGDFIDNISIFLANIGIEELSQSALCKLTEQISDRIGINVSNSKTLLEEGTFSSVLKESQFKKLFMSIFCDILVQNGVININV